MCSQYKINRQSCALNPIGAAVKLSLSVAVATCSFTVFAQISDLGVANFTAHDMSANGQVIIGRNSSNQPELWTVDPSTGSVSRSSLALLSGGAWADPLSLSANGTVVVGVAPNASNVQMPVLWSNGSIYVLGNLGSATGWGQAYAVSDDGTVVVGRSGDASSHTHGFIWIGDPSTGSGHMTALSELSGGDSSNAEGISGNGLVPVGNSNMTAGSGPVHATRWVGGVAQDLGVLPGGQSSFGFRASYDGSVVVGGSEYGGPQNTYHAFRWVSGATTGVSGNPQLFDLGTLGGNDSWALGISPDGAVIVGYSKDANSSDKGFRWSQSTGMQSIEQWLADSGVTVDSNLSTSSADAISDDKKIIMGTLTNGHPYIAVGSDGTSSPRGLLDLVEINDSLANSGNAGLLRIAQNLNYGAHGHPMDRRVPVGQRTFWVAGDLGKDEHFDRSANNGLAEVGIGINIGSVQINASLGRIQVDQELAFSGRAVTQGFKIIPTQIQTSNPGVFD